MGKIQFHESDSTRKIVGLKFGAGSSEFIRQSSHIQVLNSRLYDDSAGKWTPAKCGPLDRRLGTASKEAHCKTCGCDLTGCVGHFGYVDLGFPVFHVGFFKLTIRILQCICKSCSGLLLNEWQQFHFLRKIAHPYLNYLQRKALHKAIIVACKRTKLCPRCGHRNGVVKKAIGSILKIAYENDISALKQSKYSAALESNPALSDVLHMAKYTLLNPLRVQKLFANVAEEDIPILMVTSGVLKHPNDLLLTRIPVPPASVRPSALSEAKTNSTEDDLTVKLAEIILLNNLLHKQKKDGAPMKTIMETWDHLQIQVALYFNGELSGLPPELQSKKPIRGLTQRLKGKHGRFRENLSGKRVDYSARTVISPDPNLRIDEVGVPVHVALTLTYPEIVNNFNIDHMKKLVISGPYTHPGANYVIDHISGTKRLLKHSNREMCANTLKVGDIVERHLDDNDIVLFNRQPSLHKVSIMCHKVKVLPGRTLRLNECVCTPYNADFDGDEMNIHVPQTHEARAEASILLGVRSNLITPTSGQLLVAAIQDFITGAYLITHKDTFFSYSEVCRLAASIIHIDAKQQKRIHLPTPAIIRPTRLWTGKQLMELVISSDIRSPIKLNLSTHSGSATSHEGLHLEDSFTVIRNGQLISGVLDKSLVGTSSKTNIFYVLLRDFGEDAAVEALWRLSRMTSTFFSNHGFSVGIRDAQPSSQLLCEKAFLLREGYEKCQGYIDLFNSGRLEVQSGYSMEETLEAHILKELSSVRDKAGRACVRNLSKYNSLLTMALCGSKGSYINLSQMIVCVGQQAVSNRRPLDGFDKRSLPHFEKSQKAPIAKGFVENSFFSGLTPTEFFFHTMAGREGLVDTAVKTSETGYMQRRLVKCLEDLCACYDGTIRSSVGDVIQFVFGEDGLDPALMETDNGDVINFTHQLEHVRNTIPFIDDEQLSGNDMEVLSRTIIDTELGDAYQQFRFQLEEFVKDIIQKSSTFSKIPRFCCAHSDGTATKTTRSCAQCFGQEKYRKSQVYAHCVTRSQFVAFLQKCCLKVKKAAIEPGTAVGAIAATSIGEPSTQMTLKTFHFAGVASMNITQGVPRIKEIINAMRTISTPIINVTLTNNTDEKVVRQVKARIDTTTLGEICEYIEEIITPNDTFLLLKLDMKRIRKLNLEITLPGIVQNIISTKGYFSIKASQITVVGKSMVIIRPRKDVKCNVLVTMQIMKQILQKVIVKGLPNIKRCVVHMDEKHGDKFGVVVEGNDFRGVLSQIGIDTRYTKFNNAVVVAEVLGIEAARNCIISEVLSTMDAHGIGIDRRHVMLLADLMTHHGEVLGVTRNGLARMKESVLSLASFEKTVDHLFEAAFYSQKDSVRGVSERIILGIPMPLGTGMFSLHQKLTEPTTITRREPIFMKPEFSFEV